MQTPTSPAMFDIARRGHRQSVPAEPAKAPVEQAKAPVEPAKAPVEPAKAPVEPAKAPVEPAKAPKRPSILAKALFPIRAMRKGKLGALPICFLHHLSYKELLQLEQDSRTYMYDAFIQPCTWVSGDYQHCPMESKVTAKYIQRDSTAPLQRIFWSSSRVGVYYNPEGSILDANDIQQLIRDLRRWRVPLCPHTDMDDPELLAQLGIEASARVANDEHALCTPMRCSNKYCRTYFYFSHYHMAHTRGLAICLETRRFIDFAATGGFLPDVKHNLWLESTMGYRKLWEWMCRNVPAQIGGMGYFAAPDSLVALPPGEKDRRAEIKRRPRDRESPYQPYPILDILKEENELTPGADKAEAFSPSLFV